MLDSLVRVSRRVGQVTDRFATDPEPAADSAATERPQLAGTDDSPHSSNGRPEPQYRDRPRSQSSSVRRRANASRVYNAEPLRDRSPSPGASDRRRTGRGAPPTESAPVDHAITRAAPLADATTREPRSRQVESDGRTLRSSPFASERFHVLLNSLFKVLFNFPSRYLFAIGLVSVFSLRWSLPPALGCIIKQPDSEDVAGKTIRRRRGLTPALAKPRSGGLGRRTDVHALVLNTTVRCAEATRDSVLGSSRFTRRY